MHFSIDKCAKHIRCYHTFNHLVLFLESDKIWITSTHEFYLYKFYLYKLFNVNLTFRFTKKIR